jgi:hypothetical protein
MSVNAPPRLYLPTGSANPNIKHRALGVLTGGGTKQIVIYPASLATIVKEVGVDARVVPFTPASFALTDRIAALIHRVLRLLTGSESGPVIVTCSAPNGSTISE